MESLNQSFQSRYYDVNLQDVENNISQQLDCTVVLHIDLWPNVIFSTPYMFKSFAV